MNGYKRYIAVCEGKSADILPRVPILMQFAAEYIGENYGTFASDHKVLVEANLACACDFGMDQVSAISDPYRETDGFGGVTSYRENSVPLCSPPLADEKNLALLKTPDPYTSPRMADRVKAIEEFARQCSGVYSILGWVEGPLAEASDVRGVGSFLIDLMDDVPFCEELMDRCVDVAIEFARAQVEAGADTIGVGDALASQVSPDVYMTLVQPREKKLCQAIRDMGAYVKLHICGNITHLLPGIAELPISIIDIDHMVDMQHVREIVGKEVVITGNINPAAGVKDGTPEKINQYIDEIYAQAGNPYMVNAGCEIPSGTSNDNLKALCRSRPYKT